MMPQLIKEQSSYAKQFHAFQESACGRMPSWVERLRESAMERFETLGFPTTSEEHWKYTSVAAIAKEKFEVPAATTRHSESPLTADAIEPFVYTEARDSRLVFVNGSYRPELSSLAAVPPGVYVAELGDALSGDHEAVVREHLARNADYNTDAFTGLNTAFLSNGAVVFVPNGVQAETPIHLLFISHIAAAEQVASFPRILIVAGQDSHATIIESHVSTGEQTTPYFTNAVVETFVKENARLVHYKVQNESLAGFHVAATHAKLERSSVYDTTNITLGAQIARHNIGFQLGGEGIECWVDGLYIVGTGQHADTHSLITHAHPHCTSHQMYKGILDGKSRAVFNGRIFVHPEAQKTDAYQTNKNLLLSNESRIDTKPQLEIFADDVKCSHGATVGQLNEEELFYLSSRGLPSEVARNLLTYGFAEEVVEKIKVESIKVQLNEAILNRLHARLEN